MFFFADLWATVPILHLLIRSLLLERLVVITKLLTNTYECARHEP